MNPDTLKNLESILKSMDADRIKDINLIRNFASENMNDIGFMLFDIAICGMLSHQQQMDFIKDVKARFGEIK